METVYDKLRRLKDGLAKEGYRFDDKVLSLMMGKLERWHYPKKRKQGMTLTRDEVKVYEHLRNNKLNHSTVYKWFLACMSTGDVSRKLMEVTIRQRYKEMMEYLE